MWVLRYFFYRKQELELLRLFGVRYGAFLNDGADSMSLICPLRGQLQRSTKSSHQIIWHTDDEREA
jgi:hypothetical protein